MKSAVAVILLLACGQSLTQEYNLFFRHPQQPSLPMPNPPSEQLPYGEQLTTMYQETSKQNTKQQAAVKQDMEEAQDFSQYDYYFQPNEPIQTMNLVQPPVLIETATPDPYQTICPCKPTTECPRQYGISIYDIRDFGAISPCREYGFVRCCGNPLPTPEPAHETLKYRAPVDYANPTQDGKDNYQNEVYNEPETPVEVHENQVSHQEYAPAHDETSDQPTKVEMIFYPPGTLEETEGQHTSTNYEQTGTVQQENQHSYDTYTSPEQKQGVIVMDEKSYQTQYQAPSAENVEIVPITATSKPYNPSTYMKPAQQYSSVKEHGYNQYSIETPVLPPSMPGQSPMHVKFEIPQHKTQYPTKPEHGFRPVPKYSTPLSTPEYSPTMQPTMVHVPVVAPVRVPYQTTSMQIEVTTTTPPAPVTYASIETAQAYEHHVQQTQYQPKFSNNKYTNTYQHAQPPYESQNKEGTTADLLNLPIVAPLQEQTHGLLPAPVSTDVALPVEHREEEPQGNSPYNPILKQYHESPTSAPSKYEPIKEETHAFVPAPASSDIPLPGEHREEITESRTNYLNKPAAKQYQQYPISSPRKYENTATIEYTPTTTVPPCHQKETTITHKQETTTEAVYTAVTPAATSTSVEYGFQPLTQYRSATQESYLAPETRVPQPAQPRVPQAIKPQTYPAMKGPSRYQVPIQQQPQYLEPQMNHAASPPLAATPGSSSYRGQVHSAAPATGYFQYPPFATNSGYDAAPAHVLQPAYQRPQQAHVHSKNQPFPMPMAHHNVPHASSSFGMSWQQPMPVNQFAQNIRTGYSAF